MLEKLAAWLKIDFRYLLRGNFWLGSSTLVGAAAAFVTALLFGNFAAPETYGTYRFILSYYSILTIVGLSGFNAATVRAVAQGYEGEVLRSFKLQILSSLVGTAVAFGFGGYYFLQSNQVLGISFLVLGLALPFIESLAIYEAYLSGRQEFKKLSQYSITAQIIAAAAIAAAVLLHSSLVGLIITFFAVWILVRLVLFRHTLHRFPPNRQTAPETVRLGTHLTVMGLLNNVANYLDRIVLFHYLGAAEVAVYSFAIAPAEQAKGFFKNTNLLALSRFSERSEPELKQTMLRKILLMALVVAAATAAYILLAPILFAIFLPKYQASVFPSQIFFISLFGVIATLPVSALKSLPKIRQLYLYNIILPILNIALILTLTPLYGLFGTILARLVGRLAGIGLALIAFYRS